ncbi:MAG: DNA-deoxyinosine glycosylase [Lachnospiraceae bacterium]
MKVSLIIPIYNAEKYLRRCLSSAMSQNFSDMEILLMNDGSTDDSLEICYEYEKMDKRFRIITKENSGVSDTRNLALKEAKGEYLQFMDSDDWITPDATECLVYAADKYDCDLVVADFYRVDGAVFTEKQHIRERGSLTREMFAEYMMEEPADFYYGVLWNKLYRNSIIKENNIEMDTTINWCEDFLFNLEFIRYAKKFTAIQTPIYYYMKRKGSLVNVSRGTIDMVKFKMRLLECYKDLFQSIHLYEEHKIKINAFVVSFAKDGGVSKLPMSKRRQKLKKDIYIEEVSSGYERVKHELEPIYNKESKLLILGTFPSVKSRETQFYYGNSQNRFWKMLGKVFEEEIPTTIEDKKAFLYRHHIALWDVVNTCDIKGSSDSSICNVIPNDINHILRETSITRILANGEKANKLYMRHCFELTGRECVKCPSTSAANAIFTLERLETEWKPYLIT